MTNLVSSKIDAISGASWIGYGAGLRSYLSTFVEKEIEGGIKPTFIIRLFCNLCHSGIYHLLGNDIKSETGFKLPDMTDAFANICDGSMIPMDFIRVIESYKNAKSDASYFKSLVYKSYLLEGIESLLEKPCPTNTLIEASKLIECISSDTNIIFNGKSSHDLILDDLTSVNDSFIQTLTLSGGVVLKSSHDLNSEFWYLLSIILLGCAEMNSDIDDYTDEFISDNKSCQMPIINLTGVIDELKLIKNNLSNMTRQPNIFIPKNPLVRLTDLSIIEDTTYQDYFNKLYPAYYKSLDLVLELIPMVLPMIIRDKIIVLDKSSIHLFERLAVIITSILNARYILFLINPNMLRKPENDPT